MLPNNAQPCNMVRLIPGQSYRTPHHMFILRRVNIVFCLRCQRGEAKQDHISLVRTDMVLK